MVMMLLRLGVQRLTGGDLIARNMTYIALFRGNDFLPSQVKRTLEEKNRIAATLLEEEERVRLAGFAIATPVADVPPKLRYCIFYPINSKSPIWVVLTRERNVVFTEKNESGKLKLRKVGR